MQMSQRIESALENASSWALTDKTPQRLAESFRYALFPGGGRVRPRICLSVAGAFADPKPDLSEAAAAAIEMIHCASLVHDDLPCFDGATLRRGRPSLHQKYGQELAVLVGDGLIVAAFGWIAKSAARHGESAVDIAQALALGSGAGEGLVAGQAWESETSIDLHAYHKAKTAALFAAAVEMGALAAGQDGTTWRKCGLLLGEAYQIADDIADHAGAAGELGKSIGRDRFLNRPNVVLQFGMDKALQHMKLRLSQALDSLPFCPGRDGLAHEMTSIAHRLCPKNVIQTQSVWDE